MLHSFASDVMTRFVFFLVSVFALSVQATAQMSDFPIGFDAIPKTKLKGSVHTVLTVRQRGEKVFSTDVEVYDLNGRLIETMNNYAGIEIHSNSMVRLGGKSTFTYDTSGKLIKEKSFFTRRRIHRRRDLYLRRKKSLGRKNIS